MAHGKYLSNAEKEALARMAADGASYLQIARALNRSTSAAHRWVKLWRAGLLMRPYTKAKNGARSQARVGEPEAPQPWKPGDPKPEWLKRGAA